MQSSEPLCTWLRCQHASGVLRIGGEAEEPSGWGTALRRLKRNDELIDRPADACDIPRAHPLKDLVDPRQAARTTWTCMLVDRRGPQRKPRPAVIVSSEVPVTARRFRSRHAAWDAVPEFGSTMSIFDRIASASLPSGRIDLCPEWKASLKISTSRRVALAWPWSTQRSLWASSLELKSRYGFVGSLVGRRHRETVSGYPLTGAAACWRASSFPTEVCRRQPWRTPFLRSPIPFAMGHGRRTPAQRIRSRCAWKMRGPLPIGG